MKLPALKLLVIQEVYNGPWRWCIVDDKNRVVARSPDEYMRKNWTFKNLVQFIHAFSAGPPPKIEYRPAVQLSLFKDEKVTV